MGSKAKFNLPFLLVYERQAIFEKVDQLMALCDNLEARTKRPKQCRAAYACGVEGSVLGEKRNGILKDEFME